MPSATPPPVAPCGRHAAVVVLGELCQSPRMVAHARELLAAGWSVDVLGYGDAPDAAAFAAGLNALPGMRVVRLRSFATGRYTSALLAAPVAALRVLLLFLHTLWALVVRTRRAPDVILAQTPPALPTLLAVPLAALPATQTQQVLDLVQEIYPNFIAAPNVLYTSLNNMGSFRQMDQYAGGGIATRPSIFGDAGPEMAIPLERTPRSLSLLRQTERILGAGGGGDNINISYSPVVYGGGQGTQQALKDSFEEFKRWIEEYFEGKERVSFG